MQEVGIGSYDELAEKSAAASHDFNELREKIKTAENRMAEIAELQKYIGQYSKTRDTYAKYKASGWGRDFYDAYTADIILHRAAKKYFDRLGLKKLPTMDSLKKEYAILVAGNKKLYPAHKREREKMIGLLTAKQNVDRLLGISPATQNQHKSYGRNTDAQYKRQRPLGAQQTPTAA
ncbi:hypothetical protein FACS1894191_7880 [Clostridia bacterium]|nr:hypothetical protein FACS1894191_7880 [Clostridia bacterium]